MKAWLQAVVPVFIVIFAFIRVLIADYSRRLAGWMTFFGATVLMNVSVIKITFSFAVLFNDPPGVNPIFMYLIGAVQHLYFIVAQPVLFISISVVVIKSAVLPGFSRIWH